MTEVMNGAVMLAVSIRHGCRLDINDADLLASYMGLNDKYLFVSPDLNVMVIRHYLGGRKFTDTPCNRFADVVELARGTCSETLEWAVNNPDEMTPRDVKAFRKELRQFERMLAVCELAG